VLKELKAPNVVRLYDVIHEKDEAKQSSKMYLVFEFFSRDLKAYMDAIGPQGMDPELVKIFSKQMLNGLAECHSRRVLHRDLKPQNLLIDARGRLMLADFGLARAFMTPIPKYTHDVVTLWYRAPEILLGSDYYSTATDLWSAGCIIAEMNNLCPLFAGDSEIDQLFRIFRVLGTPKEESWPGVSLLPDYSPYFPQWPAVKSFSRLLSDFPESGVDLVKRLVTYVPSNRMTAAEAINHPYFLSISEHAQDPLARAGPRVERDRETLSPTSTTSTAANSPRSDYVSPGDRSNLLVPSTTIVAAVPPAKPTASWLATTQLRMSDLGAKDGADRDHA
jgi:serine/threonine protein kinase